MRSEVSERALNTRRALSEEAPRRTRTFDETFESIDEAQAEVDESGKKRRRLDEVGRADAGLNARSISEILPETGMYDDSLPLPSRGDTLVLEPEPSVYLYIDRISPDVSDRTIRAALDSHVLPQGVEKVKSLEVIRTQKSRHVHAFAILKEPISLDGQVEVPVSGGEYIQVQRADKELTVPPPPAPCATLHIRIYARRSGWSAGVQRMTWAGLLTMLDFASPGVSQLINMVADDRSLRSNTSHPANIVCVFFAQCASVEDAMQVHQRIHDQTTYGLDDTLFLIRADYAKGTKKLHDTSENQQQLQQRFANAREFARSIACLKEGEGWQECPAGKGCPVPEGLRQAHKQGLHDCFVFNQPRNSPPAKGGRKGKAARGGGRRRKDRASPGANNDGANDSSLPHLVVRGPSDMCLPGMVNVFTLDPDAEASSAWDYGRVNK